MISANSSIFCPSCNHVNITKHDFGHVLITCSACSELISCCTFCGKTNLDTSSGCLDAGVFSPAVGDWVCGVILSTETVDN